MLPFERASQNSWLGHIFARNWRPYQKFTFLAGLPVAQNLSQSRFSCMLIPFSMDLLDSDEGIVKYSPLYGRGSKVTILVGRYFQSRILPFERASQKTWFGHIFVRIWRPNQKCNFLAGLPYPPERTFYDSGPTRYRGTKPVFLHVDSIFNVFILTLTKAKSNTHPCMDGKAK